MSLKALKKPNSRNMRINRWLRSKKSTDLKSTTILGNLSLNSNCQLDASQLDTCGLWNTNQAMETFRFDLKDVWPLLAVLNDFVLILKTLSPQSLETNRFVCLWNRLRRKSGNCTDRHKNQPPTSTRTSTIRFSWLDQKVSLYPGKNIGPYFSKRRSMVLKKHRCYGTNR